MYGSRSGTRSPVMNPTPHTLYLPRKGAHNSSSGWKARKVSTWCISYPKEWDLLLKDYDVKNKHTIHFLE